MKLSAKACHSILIISDIKTIQVKYSNDKVIFILVKYFMQVLVIRHGIL